MPPSRPEAHESPNPGTTFRGHPSKRWHRLGREGAPPPPSVRWSARLVIGDITRGDPLGDLCDKAAHIRLGLLIGIVAVVLPAAALEEQAGPQVRQRGVALLVGYPGTRLEGTPMLVALESIGKAPDALPRCTGSRDVRGMKIGVWNVIHGKWEEMPNVREVRTAISGSERRDGSWGS
jgi:hypothetical protein